MPRRVQLYIGLVAAVAVASSLASVTSDSATHDWPWLTALVILVACIILERRAAQMPGGNTVSIATIPHLAAIFLLPPTLAIIDALAGILVEQLRLRERPSRVVFNTANTTLSVGSTAFLAQTLGAHGANLIDGGLDDVARFFVIIVAYYLINSLLLAGVMALSNGRALWQVFWESARSSAPAEVAVSVIGGLAVFIWLTNAAWLPVVLFPMLIAQLTLDYLAATDRKTRELEHQAFHDPLTGLYNRAALQRHLAMFLQGDKRGRERAALLMLDLDGFKDVNDTFGHQHGDALLCDVAARLTMCIGSRGEVVRLGGDEFAMLLRDADGDAADGLAGDVRKALTTPVNAAGIELFMGGSIGIAVSPDDGSDPETLLRRADVAMYAAKRNRAGWLRYSADLDCDDRERLTLLHDFHVALADGTLSLMYQPKVDTVTRQLHSAEALLRWTHPTRGDVSPSVFVPLAEQAGLSGTLVQWVLDAALAQSRRWSELGRSIPVCVNISMYDLRDTRFPDLVADRLSVHGVHPQLLGIEVTESAAMADPQRTRIALERLRAQGIRISVDDFGTGYSSLAYLVGLPVDELKIDRSFVLGMHASAQHTAIVRSTISLGHDLNLTVVAEGVEDFSTWNRLAGFGCDFIQGYVVSRPLTAADFMEWLDRFEARVVDERSAAA